MFGFCVAILTLLFLLCFNCGDDFRFKTIEDANAEMDNANES